MKVGSFLLGGLVGAAAVMYMSGKKPFALADWMGGSAKAGRGSHAGKAGARSKSGEQQDWSEAGIEQQVEDWMRAEASSAEGGKGKDKSFMTQ